MKKFAQLLVFLFVFGGCLAQETGGYQLPSAPILALADYQRPPLVQMDSKHVWLVSIYRDTYKSLEDLGQDQLRLAGLRLNASWHAPSGLSHYKSITYRKLSETVDHPIKGMPEPARIAYLDWSPDEQHLAFIQLKEEGSQLWVIDLALGEARHLSDLMPNACMGNPINWSADSQSILLRTVPQNNLPLKVGKSEPIAGPSISNSEGVPSQNRTYPDLLKNDTDSYNLEVLLNAEYWWVPLNGKEQLLLGAQLALGESISPDGHFVMVTTVEKPYSYSVPLSRFPQRSIVYTAQGKAVKQVNHLPLNESIPKGFSATRKGKRTMGWRPDLPHSLWYVTALDEGDPAKQVTFRDQLCTWKAPFEDEPETLMKIHQRFAGVSWGDATHAVVLDEWYDTRNSKTYLFNPSNPTIDPVVVFDRNTQDSYNDPGSFETERNQFNRQTLAIENDHLFLLGDGFTEKGQFPFVSTFHWNSHKINRLYTSNRPGKKEDIRSIIDFKKRTALVSVESPTEYPNYYFCSLSNGKLQAITHFKNPFSALANVHKEVIHYQRKDGLDLTGTLYLPADYDLKNTTTKLPLLIWAYPQEFKDRKSASQNTKNPYEFTYPTYGSFIYWVTKGYAVLDDASFPIIGEGKTEPNDSFLPQLISNAEAAIAAVDQRGYIDPKRVAIGGHSYGAFMTANLLTHTKLFACGIARSGAYNRTLTPFGFQGEQRNYWDAPKLYNDMSPFMHADLMKTPMLLIHGIADNNPGTFTLQTERYFQALKNLGAPVRMVLLPKESHGYLAKENIFHVLWEQEQFLDKYLKPLAVEKSPN
ncbi:MAG: S9 family peptidase [Flavobacterium sp. BFFFF2]|nr:MAG: S9 family peptidase [Flavobacterium sp. BFFFF2]